MKIQSEKIELVDIHSIIPNPKNANQHPKEQIERLKKLIQFQGFRNPLIISNRTGFLVVGHGRLQAARELGMEKIPVIKQDFENEAQEYAYLVSDNEIARWASLDANMVNTELIGLGEFDIELLGIKDFEIEIDTRPIDSNDEKINTDEKCAKCGQIIEAE